MLGPFRDSRLVASLALWMPAGLLAILAASTLRGTIAADPPAVGFALAAADFDQLARERDLPYRAASAGTDPDAAALLSAAVIAGALIVFGVSFYGMRTQLAVGDEQFLRSMIPHHSGAILMCQEASITDPEIQALCNEIIESQRREIAEMEALIAELEKE